MGIVGVPNKALRGHISAVCSPLIDSERPCSAQFPLRAMSCAARCSLRRRACGKLGEAVSAQLLRFVKASLSAHTTSDPVWVPLHQSINQLQDLRDRYENLFQAPQGDAMLLFMWQDDIIGVARFIDACLERMSTSAGPLVGTRHLISPELAGKDVMILLLLQSITQKAEGAPRWCQ